MVRKKVEGDEEQRRAAARAARRAGESPSAEGTATGASKQRAHRSEHADHDDKMASRRRGKQGEPLEGVPEQAAREPQQTFSGRGRPSYTEAHERVFGALSEAERAHGGEAVNLDEISRAAGLSREETRVLLRDLVSVHRLVTELEGVDTPDQGPRFEVKPRM